MQGVIADLRAKQQGGPITFGFIEGDDSYRYFFFAGGMQQTSATPWDGLGIGMRVEFTPIGHPNGPRAIEVRTSE